MIPTLYDLRLVEERYREMRREAAAYRLVQASRLAPAPGPGLLDRMRPYLTRLHLARPIAGQAKMPS